jgi:hypothetical protein
MTILLSQLFSPATLRAAFLFAPKAEPAGLIRTHAPDASAPRTDRFLNTVFGLPPMREERPYAL